MKFLFVSLILVLSSTAAMANSCDVQTLVKPFKADLEKHHFAGRAVSFRLLLTGPTLRNGKYFFIADDGKWNGSVKVDLQNCKMETDSPWVMWRTVDELGNY